MIFDDAAPQGLFEMFVELPRTKAPAAWKFTIDQSVKFVAAACSQTLIRSDANQIQPVKWQYVHKISI